MILNSFFIRFAKDNDLYNKVIQNPTYYSYFSLDKSFARLVSLYNELSVKLVKFSLKTKCFSYFYSRTKKKNFYALDDLKEFIIEHDLIETLKEIYNRKELDVDGLMNFIEHKLNCYCVPINYFFCHYKTIGSLGNKPKDNVSYWLTLSIEFETKLRCKYG